MSTRSIAVLAVLYFSLLLLGLLAWSQRGSASKENQAPANVVGPAATSYATISAGTSHTCALTTSGGVKCWGLNVWGQLGDNSMTNRRVPVDVNTLTSGVSAIAAGWAHTCAVTTTGGAKCWGRNYEGQLGNNWTDRNSYVPVNVNTLTSGVSAIAAGYQHTCALTTAGGIKCWGWNAFGQLGNNSTTNSKVPVDVYEDPTPTPTHPPTPAWVS